MRDQADELRALVRRRAGGEPAADQRPRIVAVAGGRGGVGVSTLAVNLATALSINGRRVVLVDGAFAGGGATQLCDLAPACPIREVLAGGRTVHEALERGPAGVQVLGAADAHGEPSLPAVDRLLEELRQLGPHAEWIVVDAGSSLTRAARRIWRQADLVLTVTTPEPLAVMDTYAAVKSLYAGEVGQPPQLVVNVAEDSSAAGQCHARLARACRQFLRLELPLAGEVLIDPAVVEAARRRRPLVLELPHSPAARCVERIGDELQAQVSAAVRGGVPSRWPVAGGSTGLPLVEKSA